MARSSTKMRTADMFASAPAQLDLGLSGTSAGASQEHTAKEKRLRQLIAQRDAMRARGWATADLDAMIARNKAALLGSFGNPISNPTGAMFRDTSGVLHPIRAYFKGHGGYDKGIEQRRQATVQQAVEKGGLPDRRGTIRERIGHLRQDAEKLLREAATERMNREERAPKGSFEQRHGIARPPRDITQYWRKSWHRLGSQIKPKAYLSEDDVLRLWAAYQREAPDAKPEGDWYREVHPDTYQEAMHGTGGTHSRQRSSHETAAPLSHIRHLERAGSQKMEQAERLESELDPAGRYARLERDFNDALEAGDFGQADRLDKELRPLGERLSRFGKIGRVQRLNNPSGMCSAVCLGVAALVALGFLERQRA